MKSLSKNVFDPIKQEWVCFAVFSTSWCIPCKHLEETIVKIESQWKDKIKIVRISDEEIELLQEFHIIQFPTVILFKAWTEVERIVWNKEQKVFEKAIEYHLKNDPTPLDDDNPLYDISSL